jgi:hypothetical protein
MIVIALGVQAEAEFAIPVSDLDVVMGRRERLALALTLSRHRKARRG